MVDLIDYDSDSRTMFFKYREAPLQPSRGSTGNTDFVQSHAVNYQSVLGANNSLASNQANFLVIQGFANRHKAYFVDFPTMTLPSVMQT